MHELLFGVVVGIVGGVMSGLLGITSGGALVPLSVLFLGVGQHVAQGISLIAQVFPTSLAGVSHYRRGGHAVALRTVVSQAAGFVLGGIAGALLAGGVSDRALKWTFVGYLVLLGVLVVLRRSSEREGNASGEAPPDGHPLAIAFIGFAGGVSSGLLGIGGGLAITALSVAALKMSQHRAQALSLAVTALPLTAPAALAYIHEGVTVPWLAIAGIVLGLWGGTAVGARFATRLDPLTLRRALIVLIFAMAAYMAWKAAT